MKTDMNFTDLFLNTLKNTVEEQHLIDSGDKILVALSGGADSVSMLDALCRLKDYFKIEVGAAHVNHMIRGLAADSDEAFAAELCTSLSVPFFAQRADVPKLAKSEGISEELAGRRVRYDFFEKISDEKGYNKIATAHNKNDLAETVLMRIIRGTGTDGLGGIKYKREDGVIRPILDIKREIIEGYCSENNLKYCTDSTNSDNDYTRNRVRNELLPFLAERFNPKIVDSLSKLSHNADEDSDFINGYASRLYKRLGSPMPKRTPVLLETKSLLLIEEGIRFRLFRLAAKETMGEDYEPERVHIDAINSIIEKETGATVTLPKGLRVSVKYGWLEFVSEKSEGEKPPADDFCYEIDIDREIELDGFNIKFGVTEGKFKAAKNRMLINYDLLDGKKLYLRNRKFGDKIVLYKDGKKGKVKDYFINEKVPVEKRKNIPLLCTDNEVVAIIGMRISEKYKMNADTKKGLIITYEGGIEDWQSYPV